MYQAATFQSMEVILMTDRQKEAMTKLQKYIMEIHRIPMHKVPDFCGQLWNLADDIAEDLHCHSLPICSRVADSMSTK